ncbi:MAG: 4-(cytidine 5'-diphospho)-2-C-methyl-D-erythritol kinase [Fermentimonas sp.]|nr:4-(cytidine 5'-diphospho)-2-C-methyl-D-erythritol kinase [Fermentimonas sp.]
MICFPNAKINLGLQIVSRRSDGYHNLETIFYPIDLKDALEILPAYKSTEFVSQKNYRFFQHGNTINGEIDDNLVIKSFLLISQEREIPLIDIHLLKKIPSGAGLGGGSSDAAFMLRLLNDTFDLKYSINELMRLASKIGADCPFFLHNKPVLAKGIGNELEAIDINLSEYFLLLVKPDISVATKEAYAMITPQQPELSLKEIVKRPINEWNYIMKNDFETPIFKKYPEICNIKNQLLEMGAHYSSMSGSGSSVYGIFKNIPDFKGLFKDCFVWCGKLN